MLAESAFGIEENDHRRCAAKISERPDAPVEIREREVWGGLADSQSGFWILNAWRRQLLSLQARDGRFGGREPIIEPVLKEQSAAMLLGQQIDHPRLERDDGQRQR